MKLLLLPILLMTIAASNFCQIIPLIAPLPATPVVVSTPSPPSPSPPPPPETTYAISWGKVTSNKVAQMVWGVVVRSVSGQTGMLRAGVCHQL